MALALALSVSPATLLMPAVGGRDAVVTATGVLNGVAAELLWRWLSAGGPLPGSGLSMMAFGDRAWPKWEIDEFAKLYEKDIPKAMNRRGDGDD